MEFLLKLLVPVLVMGGIVAVIGIWGSVHRSLGESGQKKSEKMGNWAIYALFGGIILLALIFGSGSNENLPFYLQ